jgi:predicted acyltransferase
LVTDMKPHRGTAVLVLGILGIVICQPLGIAAWVMGNNDLREMNNGLMDPSGRDTTNAGRICGIIGTALFILSILLMMVVLVMGGIGAVAASQSASRQHTEMTPIPTH